MILVEYHTQKLNKCMLILKYTKKDDGAQTERISAMMKTSPYIMMREFLQNSLLMINQTTDKDEFQYKCKEVENICAPIITKLYQNGNSISDEQNQSQSSSRPNGQIIEEAN